MCVFGSPVVTTSLGRICVVYNVKCTKSLDSAGSTLSASSFRHYKIDLLWNRINPFINQYTIKCYSTTSTITAYTYIHARIHVCHEIVDIIRTCISADNRICVHICRMCNDMIAGMLKVLEDCELWKILPSIPSHI